MDVISPRLSYSNCLMILTEALKKLKALETSIDAWYILLNICLNFAAKNLLKLHTSSSSNSRKSVSSLNSRVFSELIHRAVNHHRRVFGFDSKELSLYLDIMLAYHKLPQKLCLIPILKGAILAKKIDRNSLSLVCVSSTSHSLLPFRRKEAREYHLESLSSKVDK